MNTKLRFLRFEYVLFLMMLIIAPGLINAQTYSGGTGTTGDPYRIATVDDLQSMAVRINGGYDRNSYFKQTADIILSDDFNPASWTPIGSSVQNRSFVSDFDGNGFKIINFKSSNGGLFGVVALGGNLATRIVGVLMQEALVSGQNSNVGGIINQIIWEKGNVNLRLDIINCSFSGDIIGRSTNVGGVIGGINFGISGNDHLDANITSCSSFGSVKAMNLAGTTYFNNVGGVIGYIATENNKPRVRIENCYSEMAVNGADYVGGIVGHSIGSGASNSVVITDCIAMNTEIKGTGGNTNINRIVGNLDQNTTTQSNHADPDLKPENDLGTLPDNSGPDNLGGGNTGERTNGYTGYFTYDGIIDSYGTSVDFTDRIWTERTKDGAILYTGRSIGEDSKNNFISIRITNATVELDDENNYYGGDITIGEGGYLKTGVTSGRINALNNFNFELPDDYSKYPQMGGNISAPGKIRVSKTFKKGVWSHFYLPYAIDYIRKDPLVPLTMGDEKTPGDFYLAYYDGIKRAAFANGGNGNWITYVNDQKITHESSEEPFLKGDKTFLILLDEDSENLGTEDEVTLYFFSYLTANELDNPFWSSENKIITVTTRKSSRLTDIGWNYIGNPYSMKYSTEDFPYYCYVLNEVGDGYDIVQNMTDQYLEPSRPFFIQVPSESETEEIADVNFSEISTSLRSATALPDIHDVWMTFSNESTFDIFRVELRNDATTEYDLNKDGLKMYNAAPSKAILYSSYEGNNLAINALPYKEGEPIIVPISYYTPQAGNYTLSYVRKGHSEDITSLHLIDKTTGNSTDLLLNPDIAISSSGKGTVSNLELSITVDKVSTAVQLPGIEDIRVIISQNKFYLTGLHSEATITVYNLQGGVVSFYENINNNEPISMKQKGPYVIKISTEFQTIIRKIIF